MNCDKCAGLVVRGDDDGELKCLCCSKRFYSEAEMATWSAERRANYERTIKARGGQVTAKIAPIRTHYEPVEPLEHTSIGEVRAFIQAKIAHLQSELTVLERTLEKIGP